MNEDDFDREFKLESAIDIIKVDQVLDRLGSDYDEDGIPYWEKMECECGKLKCPKCSEVGK